LQIRGLQIRAVGSGASPFIFLETDLVLQDLRAHLAEFLHLVFRQMLAPQEAFDLAVESADVLDIEAAVRCHFGVGHDVFFLAR
jgi:hypothetical protein